ncbi:hypothetical protein HPB50_009795 [Hyalomma asiaticum]|uniref:Uncharacterized protein n=1 Tax=Hyalomma asiaticum TaxID=266040 RepID=A0ACB7SE18_HYAAI|nr:hypothetical protein HPB50_009795 [Hyalomma asiaticum]
MMTTVDDVVPKQLLLEEKKKNALLCKKLAVLRKEKEELQEWHDRLEDNLLNQLGTQTAICVKALKSQDTQTDCPADVKPGFDVKAAECHCSRADLSFTDVDVRDADFDISMELSRQTSNIRSSTPVPTSAATHMQQDEAMSPISRPIQALHDKTTDESYHPSFDESLEDSEAPALSLMDCRKFAVFEESLMQLFKECKSAALDSQECEAGVGEKSRRWSARRLPRAGEATRGGGPLRGGCFSSIRRVVNGERTSEAQAMIPHQQRGTAVIRKKCDAVREKRKKTVKWVKKSFSPGDLPWIQSPKKNQVLAEPIQYFMKYAPDSAFGRLAECSNLYYL